MADLSAGARLNAAGRPAVGGGGTLSAGAQAVAASIPEETPGPSGGLADEAGQAAGGTSGGGGPDGTGITGSTGGDGSTAWTTADPAYYEPTIFSDPPLGAPPPEDTLIRRVSAVYPAPTKSYGIPQDWEPTSIIDVPWGSLRILVDGQDVTNFRGVATQISVSWAMPFGSGPATLVFPAVTPLEHQGTGTLSWLKDGAGVEYQRVFVDGTTTATLWSGEIISHDVDISEAGWTWTAACIGDLWGPMDMQLHKPLTYLEPSDIGWLVARECNMTISRRAGHVDVVETGILSTNRGSSAQSRASYVQELLTMAVTASNGQWTVARDRGRRAYLIRLKSDADKTWNFRAGQPGIAMNMRWDASEAPNVIYGRGVNASGYAWANWKYPNLRADDSPAYPYSSPSSTISVGTTDAGTTSGDGVTTWQQRAVQLGYDITLDGVFSAADRDVAKDMQDRFGISVDGVVGPQTWAAAFGIGSNVGSLQGAFRMPLAAKPEVMPRLYDADGGDQGSNPVYDSHVLRIERDEEFGPGITKPQAIRSARIELSRVSEPGWVGTIAFRADPEDGSKHAIREGDRIIPAGFANSESGHIFHISGLTSSPWEDGSPVVATVSEHSEDLITLAGRIQRDREARKDVGRRPGNLTRRSTLSPDAVVEFDGESPAGRIPKHAIFGGLWTVIRIPVSQQGRIAKMWFTTSGPASKFYVALFAGPITAEQLVSLVGNPGAERSDGYGPYDHNGQELDDLGLIEGFGGPGQALGYGYGSETPANGNPSTPVTGKFKSTAGWAYSSAKPPWVWVAEYAPSSCFIEGRLYPAPIEQ